MPLVKVPFEVTGWEPDPHPLELGDAGPVVPGTGTGELAGLRGTFTIEHDESGPVLHLDYVPG